MTSLRREFPGIQYFRGVEVQQRGALHDHAMIRIPDVAAVSIVRLRELAMRAGFGHSVDFAPCDPGSRKAAYYVSKYVTKATDARDLVPWAVETVDLSTGEVGRRVVAGRYRTWSMSRHWGTTMAAVRAEAAVYARRKAAQGRVEAHQALLAVLVAGLGPVVVLEGAPEPET